MTSSPYLIAGLGNPGASYAGNRHNIGFMLIDLLAERYGVALTQKKFHGIYGKGEIAGQAVYLLKPETYMNKSGVAVSAAANFYKIPPEHIIILHDELDLTPGKLRIKQGGGHGGHNGLRDIDRVIGQNYWRMRLGIGHPGLKTQVTGYVLCDFADEERSWLKDWLDDIARHFPLMLRDGAPEKLMSEVARVWVEKKA